MINLLLFRIIFNEHGYTTDECLLYKPVIFSNTIQSMLAILQAMDRLQISFADPNRKVQTLLRRYYLDSHPVFHRKRRILSYLMVIMKLFQIMLVKQCKSYGMIREFKRVSYVHVNIN